MLTSSRKIPKINPFPFDRLPPFVIQITDKDAKPLYLCSIKNKKLN